MSPEDIKQIGDGRIILLFRDIEKCIETDLSTFIAHKNNSVKIDELAEIEFLIDKNKDYFKKGGGLLAPPVLFRRLIESKKINSRSTNSDITNSYAWSTNEKRVRWS